MTKYNYTGKLLDDSIVQGVENARDENHLEEILFNKGIFITSVSPTLSRWQQIYLKHFKRGELTKVTRQIQILLSSGISILEALELSTDQIKDKALRNIIIHIIGQVEAGKAVTDAISNFPILFDQLYISMVDTGELSGELDNSFERIATYREQYETTTKKIKSAIAYPLLVILVAILVVFALIIYVVPVFSSMYANFGAELPALTQTVVNISEIIRESLEYWLLTFFVIILSFLYLGSTTKFKFVIHKLFIKIPVIKLLTIKILSARFSRTMGSLLQSGVDIIYALEISLKTTGNLYLIKKMEPSKHLLSEGKSFTESIAVFDIFPRTLLRMCASGEKTGRLGEMLTKTADYYEKETESEIATLTTLIEPIIIIALGVLVAFILIAMYLPLFELVGTI